MDSEETRVLAVGCGVEHMRIAVPVRCGGDVSGLMFVLDSNPGRVGLMAYRRRFGALASDRD